jgi:hypothetical protein
MIRSDKKQSVSISARGGVLEETHSRTSKGYNVPSVERLIQQEKSRGGRVVGWHSISPIQKTQSTDIQESNYICPSGLRGIRGIDRIKRDGGG